MADRQGDIDKVAAILDRNASLPFVKRILQYQGPQVSPVLDMGNGEYATHRMAWTEAGGKYYVYPTVLMGADGKLKDYGDNAWSHVSQTGNYIELPSPEEADWFSRNYKLIWPANLR